jgi:hypothetical protein
VLRLQLQPAARLADGQYRPLAVVWHVCCVRDRFETDTVLTPPKTGHHSGPKDKASQQDPQPCEICKTSISGSNPGGASNLSEEI